MSGGGSSGGGDPEAHSLPGPGSAPGAHSHTTLYPSPCVHTSPSEHPPLLVLHASAGAGGNRVLATRGGGSSSGTVCKGGGEGEGLCHGRVYCIDAVAGIGCCQLDYVTASYRTPRPPAVSRSLLVRHGATG